MREGRHRAGRVVYEPLGRRLLDRHFIVDAGRNLDFELRHVAFEHDVGRRTVVNRILNLGRAVGEEKRFENRIAPGVRHDEDIALLGALLERDGDRRYGFVDLGVDVIGGEDIHQRAFRLRTADGVSDLHFRGIVRNGRVGRRVERNGQRLEHLQAQFGAVGENEDGFAGLFVHVSLFEEDVADVVGQHLVALGVGDRLAVHRPEALGVDAHFGLLAACGNLLAVHKYPFVGLAVVGGLAPVPHAVLVLGDADDRQGHDLFLGGEGKRAALPAAVDVGDDVVAFGISRDERHERAVYQLRERVHLRTESVHGLFQFIENLPHVVEVLLDTGIVVSVAACRCKQECSEEDRIQYLFHRSVHLVVYGFLAT